MRTLVIEDDDRWIRIFGDILKVEGKSPEFLSWGEALTELATGCDCELIVLDLYKDNEPYPPGLNFLTNMQQLGRAIPVIAVSANERISPEIVRSLVHHGVVDYFGKESFSDREFRASLNKIRKREERALDLVRSICTRFHLVATELTHRRQSRPTITINDEYDAQDLLRGLLHAYFSDVRAEEWVPSYAGGSARMDFFLKKDRIVIELKMTRAGLKQNEVVDQLVIDTVRYRNYPGCDILVCFVYDPGQFIRNVGGFEADIAKQSTRELRVIPIVAPHSG